MIISRTPLRISFFGGGTDLPEYYLKHGGAVLGSAINKYIYHTISTFPSKLFDYSIRLSYSNLEKVSQLAEIQHKPFRVILTEMGVHRDIEIHLAADLPSYSGLGSSSSFTVGLINALSAYKEEKISSDNLAYEAIRIERDVLQEAVGCQDQIFAAHGGLRLVNFQTNGTIRVDRVNVSSERLLELSSCLMLFFTGVTRKAQSVEIEKIKNISKITDNLKKLHAQVYEACEILSGDCDLSRFGFLLNDTWIEKKSLAPQVTNSIIDSMYEDALQAGALGGKLLGAGGGGFMLFFVPPERKNKVREALQQYFEVDFKIDADGSAIIYSQHKI